MEKAEEDYGVACGGLEETNYFAQVCFHFQQAAEKYLKAFIVANKLEFRAAHNLLELLDTCKQKDPGIEELEQACRFLNPFYIDTRYPSKSYEEEPELILWGYNLNSPNKPINELEIFRKKYELEIPVKTEPDIILNTAKEVSSGVS